MTAMTMYPRKCKTCGNWMEFEISYCAGNPIVTWHCDRCGTSSSDELYIVTNHTYADKDYRSYYVDTTNMQEGVCGGEVIWRGKRT